jgi:phage terminase large subunit-like protein
MNPAAPHVDAALEYARQVTAGTLLASKYTRLACQRQLTDLERFNTPDSAYYFDHAAAERVCRFLELLPHVKGRFSGRIKLEPWQSFNLTTIFGWLRRDNHARRFRLVYLEVGRKNAKSTIASGLGLYLLAADGEPGAVVVSAATTRDQAKLCFIDAQQIARRVPGFRRAFGVRVLANAITQDRSGSTFKPLSAEGKHQDGLNIHGALIDELHAHRNRGIWDVTESATGSRVQSLIIAITTAGFDQNGICYEVRSYLAKVLEGAAEDDSFYGIIYTLDEGDDWADSRNWIKANPNLNVSVYLDDLERQARKAAQTPPALNNFLTKRLSLWVNADTAWLDTRHWRKAAAAFTRADCQYRACYVGLDLATKDDLCAACFWFPADEDNPKHRLFFHFWVPAAALEKEENHKLKEFAAAGAIEVHGAIVDFEMLADDLERFATEFQIRELAVDPWQLPTLLAVLNRRSFAVPIVPERQIVAVLSPAMKECSALLLSGDIEHDGNPAMQWQIANVICHQDSKENWYPKKANKPSKIDGPVAMFLACDRWLRAQGLPSGAYEKRGEFLSVALMPAARPTYREDYTDPLAGL